MKKIVLDFENKGHYSPAIISNNMLYISGQLPVNLNKGIIEAKTIEEQVIQVLSNIDLILEKANLTKDSIVQTRVYISDIKYWDKVNEVYTSYFVNHKPARIIVPCSTLHHGALVEIEAIAEIEE